MVYRVSRSVDFLRSRVRLTTIGERSPVEIPWLSFPRVLGSSSSFSFRRYHRTTPYSPVRNKGSLSFSTFTSKLVPHLPTGFITDGAYESINMNMNNYPLLHSSSTTSTTETMTTTVTSLLDEVITYGQTMKKNSIWIHIDLAKSASSSLPSSLLGDILTQAYRKGFALHHALNSSIKLYKWLPIEVPNKVPLYATHQVGVAGVVIDNAGRLLLVQERRHSRNTTGNNSGKSVQSTMTSATVPKSNISSPQWKFPGGLADIGEAFSATAEREVFEETGLHTKFQSLLAFRHQHGMAHGVSDIYILCLLRPCPIQYESLFVKNPLSLLPLQIDKEEIADAQWMHTDDYLKITSHPLNKYVARLAYHQLQLEQQEKERKETVLSSAVTTVKTDERLTDQSIRESDIYIPVTKKQVKVYTSGNSFSLPVSLPPPSA